MVLALLLAASTQQLNDPFLTFSRSPSRNAHTITVEVGLVQSQGRTEYWLKRTFTQSKAKSIWWTDTKRCPAARSLLRAVRKLEMPRVSVPLLESDYLIITADGVMYRLKGSAEYPDTADYAFEIGSNSGTPLARWVDESLRTVDPCWSKDRPQVR